MSGVAAGIGGVVALAEFGLSAHKAKKDKEAEDALKSPFYAIQSEYQQNRNQAEQMAGQGMPTDTKNFLTQQGQQGLGASLSAIKQTGGGINDVSHLLEGYQSGLRGIGAEDAQQHIENIKYFHKLNADLAAQKTIQWGVNEKQPYEAKLKELKEAQAADQQNEWNAVNTGATSAIGAVTGNQNAALLKKLLASMKSNPAGSPQIQPPYDTSGYSNPGSMGANSPAAGFPTINPNAGAGVVARGNAGNGVDLSSLPDASIQE